MAQIEQPKRIVQSVPLPTEIVGEILLRLPVESVLRCKSVCKLWLSLISDSHFIQNHLHLSVSTRNENRHRLIWATRHLEDISLETCSVSDALSSCVVNNNNVLQAHIPAGFFMGSIAGSCNGLLCLVSMHSWSKIVVIWNPSTRQANCLPEVPFMFCTYGFGYDHSTDDYKVVAIDDAYDGRVYQANSMFYSFKTGKWKDIGYFPFGTPAEPYCSSNLLSWCFSNGALYWSVHLERTSCWVKMISLDLATETYREVLQPVFDDDDDDDDEGGDGFDYESDDRYCNIDEGEELHFRLGTLGESLCVLYNYRGKRADVWVMKVKDSWTKLMSIPYVNICKYYQVYQALFISNDGKILFRDGKDLQVYDPKTRSFSKIQNFDHGCLYACTFVESLVSLHGPTRIEDMDGNGSDMDWEWHRE